MKTINRRTFLKTTALGAAAVGLPASSWARVPGANDDIRVAIVGFGGRGKDHIDGMRKLANKGVRIVALCDVDEKILNAGVDSFAKRNEKVEGFTDIRKLLEFKDLDAITIATPNHWHSLATILAVQADKDVYVEKPVCHNVWEGSKMVEASRRHNKIVQAGTQSRSSYAIKEAVEWVRAAISGRSRLRAAFVTNHAPASAKWPLRNRRRRMWITISGAARRRRPRFADSVSTTTGIGSGILATATSATRASTKWTLPAGFLAKASWRRGSGVRADGWATRTTERLRIR